MSIHINKRGLSLVELLVGLIVSGIVVLMVAALGSLAYKTYNGLRNHSGVYNDSQFALQMIREAVRQSTGTGPSTSSTCLTVPETSNTDYFYSVATTSSQCKASSCLIYGTIACGNTTSATNKTLISGVSSLVFTPTVTGQLVTVSLSGTKVLLGVAAATLDKASFSYLMSATGRNLWNPS